MNYRPIKLGDIKSEGDQYRAASFPLNWIPVAASQIGQPYSEDDVSCGKYRRRLSQDGSDYLFVRHITLHPDEYTDLLADRDRLEKIIERLMQCLEKSGGVGYDELQEILNIR